RRPASPTTAGRRSTQRRRSPKADGSSDPPRRVGTVSLMDRRTLARVALRRTIQLPPSPELPAGYHLEIPGRGTTFVAEVPGPPGAPTLLLLHALACTAYLN